MTVFHDIHISMYMYILILIILCLIYIIYEENTYRHYKYYKYYKYLILILTIYLFLSHFYNLYDICLHIKNNKDFDRDTEIFVIFITLSVLLFNVYISRKYKNI